MDFVAHRPIVEVAEWSPQWAVRFAQARDELVPALPSDALIEHIGSTSVPGLAAKPVIDLAVITAKVAELRRGVRVFERLGYVYNPKYFADDPDHLFLKRDTDGVRTEHLHLFMPHSPQVESHRAFRNYLIAHPEPAERYVVAKRAAALAHPDSRGRYGDAKGPVLDDLLRRAHDWAGLGPVP